MLVDDDEATSYAIGRALNAAGLRTTAFQDSVSAMSEVSETTNAYDLLLTDIKFPSGQPHGLALANYTRIWRPRLPVILFSGFPEAREVALRSGYTCHPKPVDITSLLASIGKLLA
jgi:DNA-binding NtrC family response regulator